jgi:hypothetical protein
LRWFRWFGLFVLFNRLKGYFIDGGAFGAFDIDAGTIGVDNISVANATGKNATQGKWLINLITNTANIKLRIGRNFLRKGTFITIYSPNIKLLILHIRNFRLYLRRMRWSGLRLTVMRLRRIVLGLGGVSRSFIGHLLRGNLALVCSRLNGLLLALFGIFIHFLSISVGFRLHRWLNVRFCCRTLYCIHILQVFIVIGFLILKVFLIKFHITRLLFLFSYWRCIRIIKTIHLNLNSLIHFL